MMYKILAFAIVVSSVIGVFFIPNFHPLTGVLVISFIPLVIFTIYIWVRTTLESRLSKYHFWVHMLLVAIYILFFVSVISIDGRSFVEDLFNMAVENDFTYVFFSVAIFAFFSSGAYFSILRNKSTILKVLGGLVALPIMSWIFLVNLLGMAWGGGRDNGGVETIIILFGIIWVIILISLGIRESKKRQSEIMASPTTLA